MRYRKLDQNGDMVFGHGQADFYIDSPAAVAQLIDTTLNLIQGTWFLDLTAGVPWLTEVIGRGTLYDEVVKQSIQNVEGVVALGNYQSSLSGRALAIKDNGIVTQYGTASLDTSIPVGGWGGSPYNQGAYGA